MSKEKKISSRAKILATIKSSLLTPTPMPFPDLDYATEPFASNIDSLALQFAKAFTAVQGNFMYCDGKNELKQSLENLISAKKLQRIHCLDTRLYKMLSSLGFERLSDSKNLDFAEAAITSVEALCARTGTVVYTSQGEQGRTLQVFPPMQLIIAFTSQVVPDIKQALEQVTNKYNGKLPSMISFATGPSRTADIEKTLVLGAHGPREVYLFLLEDDCITCDI